MNLITSEEKFYDVFPINKQQCNFTIHGNWSHQGKKNEIKKLFYTLLHGPLKIIGYKVGRWQKIEKYNFEELYEKIINASSCYLYGEGFYIELELYDRVIGGEFFRLDKGLYIRIYNKEIFDKSKLVSFFKDIYSSIEWDAGGLSVKYGSEKEVRPLKFWGPWFIKNLIDKHKLLQIPAFKIEKLKDGGVFLQHDSDFLNYDSFWKKWSCKKFQKNMSKCFVSDQERKQKEEQRKRELGITVRMVPETEIEK